MSHRVRALAVSSLLICSGLAVAQEPSGQTALTRTFQDTSLEWGPCPAFMPEGCTIAVLNGDPGKDNADVFFKVPGGATIPRHWHTSSERMVLVSGELHVTYDGHDTAVMKPGTYAYGPANLPHEADCRGDEPCVLAIAFESPVDAFPGEPATK